jgi:tetratricopeptide (TPR) repeat protein
MKNEINKNVAEDYYNRGFTYKELGLYDKAQKDFEMYKKLTGE